MYTYIANIYAWITVNLSCQLVFEMEGFDVKVEGMFGGQVIPLVSVDGSVQGELRNWSSAVSRP